MHPWKTNGCIFFVKARWKGVDNIATAKIRFLGANGARRWKYGWFGYFHASALTIGSSKPAWRHFSMAFDRRRRSHDGARFWQLGDS